MQQLLEKRGGLRLFAAVARQKQNRRGVGIGNQVKQKRRAVQVPPLQVVDQQDHRVARRQSSHQFVQRLKAAQPKFRGVCHFHRGGSFSEALKHGEELREDCEIQRQQRLPISLAKTVQVAIQIVHQAIESLIWSRLPLVAAPLDHEMPFTLAHLVQKAARHGALAHARRTMNEDRGRPPTLDFAESLPQRSQFVLTPDERCRVEPGDSHRFLRRHAEISQDLRVRGPKRRIALQQGGRQFAQVRRCVRPDSGDRGGIDRVLGTRGW